MAECRAVNTKVARSIRAPGAMTSEPNDGQMSYASLAKRVDEVTNLLYMLLGAWDPVTRKHLFKAYPDLELFYKNHDRMLKREAENKREAALAKLTIEERVILGLANDCR